MKNLNLILLVALVAVGLYYAGAFGLKAGTFERGWEYSIPLLPGWNLVSFPLDMGDGVTASQIANSNRMINKIARYIPSSGGGFETYTSNQEFNNFIIQYNQAYYVFAVEPTNLEIFGKPIRNKIMSIPAVGGFTPIAFPFPIERKVDYALNMTTPNGLKLSYDYVMTSYGSTLTGDALAKNPSVKIHLNPAKFKLCSSYNNVPGLIPAKISAPESNKGFGCIAGDKVLYCTNLPSENTCQYHPNFDYFEPGVGYWLANPLVVESDGTPTGMSPFQIEIYAQDSGCAKGEFIRNGQCELIQEALHYREADCPLPDGYLLVAETFPQGKVVSRTSFRYGTSINFFCGEHPVAVTDSIKKETYTESDDYKTFIAGGAVTIPAGQTRTFFYVMKVQPGFPITCKEGDAFSVDACETGYTLNSNANPPVCQAANGTTRVSGKCTASSGFAYACSSGLFDPIKGICVVTPEVNKVCQFGRYNTLSGVCDYNPPVNCVCNISGIPIQQQICDANTFTCEYKATPIYYCKGIKYSTQADAQAACTTTINPSYCCGTTCYTTQAEASSKCTTAITQQYLCGTIQYATQTAAQTACAIVSVNYTCPSGANYVNGKCLVSGTGITCADTSITPTYNSATNTYKCIKTYNVVDECLQRGGTPQGTSCLFPIVNYGCVDSKGNVIAGATYDSTKNTCSLVLNTTQKCRDVGLVPDLTGACIQTISGTVDLQCPAGLGCVKDTANNMCRCQANPSWVCIQGQKTTLPNGTIECKVDATIVCSSGNWIPERNRCELPYNGTCPEHSEYDSIRKVCVPSVTDEFCRWNGLNGTWDYVSKNCLINAQPQLICTKGKLTSEGTCAVEIGDYSTDLGKYVPYALGGLVLLFLGRKYGVI